MLRPIQRQRLHQPVGMAAGDRERVGDRQSFAQGAPQKCIDQPDRTLAAELSRGFGGGSNGGMRGKAHFINLRQADQQ